MRVARPLSSVLFRNMLFVFLALCLGMGIAWIGGDLKHLGADRREAELRFTEARKDEVRTLITNLARNIENQIDTAPAKQQAAMRRRAEQAYDVVAHLYAANRDHLSRAQLIELVREAIRPLRYDDGSGYYFMFDLDGREILHADHPELEGQSLVDVADPEGRFVVREMLALAKSEHEGFYPYLWTKPGEPGRNHRKTSYIKLFEPLGLVIGTGQYEDDFVAKQQAEILERIARIHFGEQGYVFVNRYDGTALVIRSDKYKPGDNIWDLADPHGRKVVQEERRAAAVPDGDFIHYSWLEPGTDRPVRKMSFIKGIDRWQWMIGSGVYLDDLEAEVARQDATLQRIVRQAMLQVAVAFVAAILLAIFFGRRIAGKIRAELIVLGELFRDAVSRQHPIETERLGYTEFQGFADSMNEMIAARREIEAELLKARNLESIGILAGGIAHDFNNLLTAIMGNVSLALEDVPPGHPAVETLQEAERVSERARDLTQQLLAFAKGGAPVRSLEDVAAIIRESAQFSLRGSNVDLALDLPNDLYHAEVDAGQFSQVVGNLALNASQAMPEGGTLTIRARNLDLAAGEIPSLAAGPYLALEFRDSGVGIGTEELGRIFDPYYTTKPDGSGLGLASVYAIVKNHEGMVDVDSHPGRGTVFRIWIPARADAVSRPQRAAGSGRKFAARVLIMDDDPAVGGVCKLMLRRLGCEADLVGHGAALLERYREQRDEGHPYDMAILDLTIRGGMGGKEAVGELLSLDPDARAVVSSGYSNDPVMAHYEEYGFQAMIRKPYSLNELRALMESVLG